MGCTSPIVAALGGALGSLTRFSLVQISPGWDGLSAGTLVMGVAATWFGIFLAGRSLFRRHPAEEVDA